MNLHSQEEYSGRYQARAIELEGLARRASFRPSRLAEIAGLSLRTLERRIRAEHRMTVSAWIRSVRLREASLRLQAGTPVKTVSDELGFKQLSHFSREFKRAYGLAPSKLLAQKRSHAALPAALQREIPHQIVISSPSLTC